MQTIKCCFKCIERYVGCHSHCERYLKEKDELHKVYEKRLEERKVIDSIFRRRK